MCRNEALCSFGYPARVRVHTLQQAWAWPEVNFFAILNPSLVFMFIYCTARGLFTISDTTPVFVSCVAKPGLR